MLTIKDKLLYEVNSEYNFDLDINSFENTNKFITRYLSKIESKYINGFLYGYAIVNNLNKIIDKLLLLNNTKFYLESILELNEINIEEYYITTCRKMRLILEETFPELLNYKRKLYISPYSDCQYGTQLFRDDITLEDFIDYIELDNLDFNSFLEGPYKSNIMYKSNITIIVYLACNNIILENVKEKINYLISKNVTVYPSNIELEFEEINFNKLELLKNIKGYKEFIDINRNWLNKNVYNLPYENYF